MVSVVTQATPIVSSILTSSPKEATVKTATRTDAKPIVEEEDLMPQLLGTDAGPLDRDQEARRNEDSPHLAQMVEIMQEGNRRV